MPFGIPPTPLERRGNSLWRPTSNGTKLNVYVYIYAYIYTYTDFETHSPSHPSHSFIACAWHSICTQKGVTSYLLLLSKTNVAGHLHILTVVLFIYMYIYIYLYEYSYICIYMFTLYLFIFVYWCLCKLCVSACLCVCVSCCLLSACLSVSFIRAQGRMLNSVIRGA